MYYLLLNGLKNHKNFTLIFTRKGQQKIHPVEEEKRGENGTGDRSGSVSSEMKEDLRNVKADVKQLIKNIQAFSQSISQDIEDMKTVVDRTFDIVVDSRYRVLQNI
jgi:phage host-nuclease inhibitor protein Gam